MPAPLPSALWARFQRYIGEDLSDQDQRACRAIAPGTSQGARKACPAPSLFEELVRRDPDVTLFEPRDALAAAEGVRVHHSSIASLLSRLGFTCKKKSLVAAERRGARLALLQKSARE